MSPRLRLDGGCSHRLVLCAGVLCAGSCLLLLYGQPSPLVLNESWVPLPSHDSYMIRTQGCTVPTLDPLSEQVRKFHFTPEVPVCNDRTPLVQRNATHFWISTQNLANYSVSESDPYHCCYKYFRRPKSIQDIESSDVDNRVWYKDCVNVSEAVAASEEFVYISCWLAEQVFYEDYLAFVLLKRFGEDVKRRSNGSEFNVIIMGIDSLSRLNFIRTMPRTREFLLNADAVELLGYTKVGDNSYPNLVAALMGYSHQELPHVCLPTRRSTFDNCPILWSRFAEAGYVTAFGEDSATLGTFNYLKNGFAGTPTDYYLYTFMHEAETHAGRVKPSNTHLCLPSAYFYSVLLDYTRDLLRILDAYRIFAFFWEVSMSHDYLNYPMAMDDDYLRFFEEMQVMGRLKDTVFVLMSDHGMRWGDIVTTKQGRIEERMPLMYLLLPESFHQKYPLADQTLRSNARRLTTPFDIHETLADLTAPENQLTQEALERREREAYATRRGISLFLPVPANRTCESAEVADHWCVCHESRPLAADNPFAVDAAAELVRLLNKQLELHRECTQLVLANIREASELELGTKVVGDTSHGAREVRLVVELAPSGAILEATVRREAAWTLAGSVSRLNLYGKQSACVHDANLRLFCYCT